MDACIVTGMSFRNRGSFFSTGYYPYTERLESACSYFSAFPVYGTIVNSRVLYGLRQSHLINWAVHRRLSLAGPGYCRLAAPCQCHCDCERKYTCGSLSRGRPEERRQSYVLGETDGFDSSSYDSFSEMLSLLTDSGVESYVEEKNKINTGKSDTREKERNIKVEDKHLSVQRNRKNLKKKDKFVEKGNSRKLESQRLAKSIDRFRQTGKGSYLKDDTSETRKDGSSSSYYSALSEGEIASSLDMISTTDQTFYRDNIVEDAELKPNAKFKENLIGESSRVRKYNSQDARVKKSQAHEDVTEISWKEDGRKPHVLETDFERYPTKRLEKATDISGSQVSEAKKASSSQMRIVDVEETSTSYSNLVHKRKEQRVVGQKDSRRGSKVFNEAPRIQEDGTGIGSSSAKLLHIAEKDIGKTGAALDMVEEVRKQHIHIDDQFDSHIQLKEKTEIVKETSEIQSSNIVKRPSFKKPYKSRVVDSKLFDNTREYMPEKNIQVAEITDASEESHKLINVSETHSSGTERKNDSGWMYIASDVEENLVQSAGVVNEGRNEHDKIHEMISRSGLRKEHQRVSYDSDLERASSSQKIAQISKMNPVGTSSSDLNWTKGTEKPESGVPNVFERQSQPRLVLRRSHNGQESNLYQTQEAFYEILDDKDVRIGTEEVSGKPAELVVKDNTIDSADRLDKSSQQVIGEFFEKAQEAMSTTKKSSVLSKEEKYIRKDQNMSVDIQITFDDTRRSSSGGPGPKGPSDEMWAEPGLSSQEPSVTAPEDSSLTPVVESAGPSDAGSTVVRKSGRSLWGYIGNIVRTGWGTRAESNASSTKRSAKSSSNESASSESWFSGNEPEDDDVRKERRAAPKETIRKLPDVEPNNAPIPDTESTKVILQDKKADVKADPTISLSGTKLQGSSLVIQDEIVGKIGDPESIGGPSTVVRSGSSTPSFPLHSESPFSSLPLAGGSSSQSISLGENNFGISVGATIGTGIPSPVGTVDLSQPSTATSLPMLTTVAMNMSSPSMGGSSSHPESLVTSSGKEKMSKAEIEASGISLVGARVEPGKQKQAEASGYEGKDSELKQRKLQRNMQVPKDRFDEWEAAFNLEQEQKRVDEMFMREALIEAKKAADIWEVPVGAVLVQHGKIIARGCNLVEELRDSTAHAEMNCIREASGLLKTWRLSETTLYVTLEPCPMCAGAILQARIDTVVWGAPNKLLGADGSWISLFPSESDPAAPVHPFHPKMTMRRGVLATECADVMQQFFRLRRKKIRKEDPPSSHLPLASPTKFLSKIHNIFNMMFCL